MPQLPGYLSSVQDPLAKGTNTDIRHIRPSLFYLTIPGEKSGFVLQERKMRRKGNGGPYSR